jgi:hypothetical protein
MGGPHYLPIDLPIDLPIVLPMAPCPLPLFQLIVAPSHCHQSHRCGNGTPLYNGYQS